MRAAGPLLVLLASCAPFETEDQEADRLHREALQGLAAGMPVEDALGLLDDAIALWPRRADFFTARARLRTKLGRPEEAVGDRTQALSLQRESGAAELDVAATLYERARLRAELGRFDAAELDFAEALRLVPGYVEALLERARLRRAQGRDAEADADAARAREGGLRAADSFYNEGVRELNLGRAPEAERLFGLALEIDPGHVQAHVALARIHLVTRRFDRAVAALDRAIAKRPGSAELHYHRGNAWFGQDRAKEALADYAKAVELDCRPAYLVARAILHHRHLKDPEKAGIDFDRAIILDPDNYTAWLNRGLLNHQMIRLREAEHDLRRALALDATVEAVAGLARVLHDRGDFEKAVDAFQKAILLSKDEAVRKGLEEEYAKSRDEWAKAAGRPARPEEKE